MSRAGIKLHFRAPFQEHTLVCKLPYADADHAVAEKGTCPCCKATPLKVAGVKGTMVRGHDTYTSDGGCVGCMTVLGKLVMTVDTLFGIAEDEAVGRLGIRIY